MGGLGSGWRPHPEGKQLVEDYCALDIRHLQLKTKKPDVPFGLVWKDRHGQVEARLTLTWQRRMKPFQWDDVLWLTYETRQPCGHWDETPARVALDWTLCHYEGERPWFLCPECGRRVAKLQFTPEGECRCRHCLNLAYASTREDPADRLLRKARKLYRRLGGKGTFQDQPQKPKGMHWETYWRQLQAAHAAEQEGWHLGMSELKAKLERSERARGARKSRT